MVCPIRFFRAEEPNRFIKAIGIVFYRQPQRKFVLSTNVKEHLNPSGVSRIEVEP